MSRTVCLALLAAVLPLHGQCPGPPPLDEILARLAASQDRAHDARGSVVYEQNTLVRLLRTNGKLAREERRRYRVTPTADGTSKELDHFEGRYERGGKLLPYASPGFEYKSMDLDGALIESLTEDLINDRCSRDGISRDLFPLTAKEQRRYDFTVAGCRTLAGRPALLLAFAPGKHPEDGDSSQWAGEVFLDPVEFQPMLVTTRFASKIPAAVRVLLGIGLRQLGFSVSFRKVDEELWFPATYGAEFGIKVLFGYKRNITMNVANSSFRRTSVTSTILFDRQ